MHEVFDPPLIDSLLGGLVHAFLELVVERQYGLVQPLFTDQGSTAEGLRTVGVRLEIDVTPRDILHLREKEVINCNIVLINS